MVMMMIKHTSTHLPTQFSNAHVAASIFWFVRIYIGRMKRNRWNGTTFNSLLLNIHYVRLNLIVSQQIVRASPAIVVVFLRIEGFLI